MTGESQVEEPRTEAGVLERTVAGLRLSDKASGLWWQPNPLAGANAMQSATRDVRAAIRAIEDEARAAALATVEEAVAGLRRSDAVSAKFMPYDQMTRGGALDDVLAAITALRQPQEAKDTRGEPR